MGHRGQSGNKTEKRPEKLLVEARRETEGDDLRGSKSTEGHVVIATSDKSPQEGSIHQQAGSSITV